MLKMIIILAGVCQIIGTGTVTYSYYKTGRVAAELVDGFNPRFSIPFREREKVVRLASELKRRWFMTVGLLAYFLGAVLGVVAGLMSLPK